MPTEFLQPLPCEVTDRDTENLLRCAVGSLDTALPIQCHDPGGQPTQHSLQVIVLGLQFVSPLLKGVARMRDTPGHRVERTDQETELVLDLGQRQLLVIVTLSHGTRTLCNVADRLYQAARSEYRGPGGGEQTEQQDHGQTEGETEFDLRAHVGTRAVGLVGILQTAADIAQGLGHRIQRLQHDAAAGLVENQAAHQQAAVGATCHADIVVPGHHLLNHAAVGCCRQQDIRVGVAQRQHLALDAEQRNFQSTRRGAHVIHAQRHRSLRGVLDGTQQVFRQLQALALVQVQRQLAERQGILHRAVDLQIEPAVDATGQKTHRVEIDHADRHQCEHQEQHGKARTQPRTGDPQPVVAQQLPEVPSNQAEQEHQTDQCEQQQRDEPLAELLGTLHRRTDHVQRRQ